MRSALASLAVLTVALLLVTEAEARSKRSRLEAVDLTNFQLGPDYAQWLVGPIAYMASDEERRDYLALSDDAGAERFIEAFWRRRGPELTIPPSGPRHTFEGRAEEADRRFDEGVVAGRRTDRGTIYVLYGPPSSIEYASSPTPGGEPIEVWHYPRRSEAGLDGRKPRPRYGFRKQGATTDFFALSAAKKLRKSPTLGRRPGG